MMSVMRLITDPTAQFEGEVIYKGTNLMGMSQDHQLAYRGADPRARACQPAGRQGPRRGTTDPGRQLPNARERANAYPHRSSGGMRQHVTIAMAVSCNPNVLIADKPTTALDVTIQAEILTLIDKLRPEFGTAFVLITHDMGVVANMADRIAVMYAGRIIEHGTQRDLVCDPAASLRVGPARSHRAPRPAPVAAASGNPRPAPVADAAPGRLRIRRAMRAEVRAMR